MCIRDSSLYRGGISLKRLLSGNEALARGAWEADVRVAAGYPGTPSTEILETLAPMPNAYAEWCPNEKVALDVAIGAAYAGARSIAVMKHVGLNVAADALLDVYKRQGWRLCAHVPCGRGPRP